MDKSCFQIDHEVAWQEADLNIRRQVFGYNEQVMMVKVQFETGGVGTKHSHPHTQVSYVASGSFEVYIGDDTRILNAGDGFFVPPDIVHGCKCLQAGLLVDCFSPARQDFI